MPFNFPSLFDPMAIMAAAQASNAEQPWNEQPPMQAPWMAPRQQPQFDLPSLLQFMQSQMPQNAFLPDNGWFGRHPKIASAIEGAVLGAQVPSADTIGENIAGVLRTGFGVPMQREQMRIGRGMQRVTQPLQLMGMLQEMEGKAADMQYKEALGQQARAQAHRLMNPNPDYTGSQFIDENGYYWQRDERTGKAHPVKGPDGAHLRAPSNKYQGGFGAKSEVERTWVGMNGPPPDDPAERAAYFGRYNAWYIGRQGSVAANRAGAAQAATGGTPETEDRFHADQEDVYKNMRVEGKPGETFIKARGMGIAPKKRADGSSSMLDAISEHNQEVDTAWGNYRSQARPGETFKEYYSRYKNRNRVHSPRTTPKTNPPKTPRTAEDYLNTIK
jgi:hypothetical protein